MPRMNTFSARPGSILKAWDTTWKIIENDTLNMTILLEAIDEPGHRKKVRYHPGDEIFLRWVPHQRT